MKFPQKAINRFNIKVNKSDNCHNWNAARQKQGYGMFSYDGKSMPAIDLHIFYTMGILKKIWLSIKLVKIMDV